MFTHRLVRSAVVVLVVMLASAAASAQCPLVGSIATEPMLCGIRITWVRNPASPAPTGWQVFRNSTNSLAGATLINTRGPSTFEYIDTVSNTSQPLFYFVRGISSGCASGPASTIVAGMASQQIVQDVRVSAATCGSVTLTWDALNGATQYRVLRFSLTAGGTIGTVASNVTTFTDTTGVPGVEYQYSVAATSPCLVGSGSDPVMVRFPAPPAALPNSGTLLVQAGGSGSFILRFTGDLPQLNPTYRWFKDGQPLQLGGRITADQNLLIFDRFLIEDVGFYTLELATPCGTSSQSLLLAVRPSPCRGDFNSSGTLTVQDLFDFLSAYFEGCN